jgi:predicted Na+-dependent transporter
MTVGLAPCEIAAVATTAMATGDAALSAGVLIGSTVVSVAVAGPVLALEASPASGPATTAHPALAVHPLHVIASLGLVVVLPLAAGLALRARLPVIARADQAASVTATAAVVALVAVIASQVRLSAGYLPVAGALIVFLVGSAAIGRLLGARSGRTAAVAVLLTTSMRDFAIAAGLAAAAFGPAAAAPLGLYGILVLAWGTAVAGAMRRQSSAQDLSSLASLPGTRVGHHLGRPGDNRGDVGGSPRVASWGPFRRRKRDSRVPDPDPADRARGDPGHDGG